MNLICHQESRSIITALTVLGTSNICSAILNLLFGKFKCTLKCHTQNIMKGFNVNPFKQKSEKEVNKSGEKELMNRLPQELKERFIAAGGTIKLDAMSGKAEIDATNNDSIVREVMEMLDRTKK
jgi:hypothetical protein